MQPIIRDSEDEDEEGFLVPDESAISKPSQQSSNSWIVAEADAILDADQSSLSTGDLQRQIADASRGLFDSTSDQATIKQPSMASSSTPAAKNARRHSAAVGSGSAAKSVKRTKTGSVTYGSSKNTRVADSGQFDALRDEGLPGTLQTNFVNHEPTAMFRDTGSTVADNESSQQRIVEQIINHSRQLSNVAEIKSVDSDKPDSSPFPWSVSSVPTQTPGANTSKQSSHDKATTKVETATGPDPSDDVAAPAKPSSITKSGTTPGKEIAVRQDIAESIKPCSSPAMARDVLTGALENSSPTNLEEAKPAAENQSHSPTIRPSLNSSPQVSVPRVLVKSTTETSIHQVEVPKGRKRKPSAADIEPLNSDERAIGHPKELYQPRLSRRRTTGLVEQPQDFSIVPERAAKKRSKTVNTASAIAELTEDELAHDTTAASQTKSISKTKTKAKKSGDPTANTDESATATAVPAMVEKPQPAREEVRAVLKGLNFPLTNTSFDAGISEMPSPTKDASPLSAKKAFAAAVVSMPPPSSPALSTSQAKRLSNAAAASATPPPTSSASRTSRRSHTTIFEDHVDFSGSQQRSPSLRQQQAIRKSAALKEVKNGSTQATRRKRRTIVQDDEDGEDGEDELVKDPVVEAVVPKKRGRAAKAPAAKKAPSAELVLQDSDAEPGDEEIVEPPKKKGRTAKALSGQSKSTDKVLNDSEDEFDDHESELDQPSKMKAGRHPSKAKTGDQATEVMEAADGYVARKKSDSRQTPAAPNPPATPTSDKQTSPLTNQDAAHKTVAAAKSAPAAHTPIKPSSKVIHRVGLNRRQRVQPLLKIVRPPAATKQH